MPTWENLALDVQSTLDEDDGVFHTLSNVRTYLEHGELFLSFSRFLVEKTVTFQLLANVAEYPMPTTVPDWCWVLRATIVNAPLSEVKLSAMAMLHPAWRRQRGTPRQYLRLGHAMLAFTPVPDVDVEVVITYLATPPTQLSDPPAGVTPTIQEMWHEAIKSYGVLLATAKEGQLARTQTILQSIAEHAGNTRDVRFLRDAQQREAEPRVEAPLTKSTERP